MKKSIEDISYLLVLASLLSILKSSTAIDTINTTQILRDGDTLVSSGGFFELGFFSPGNSKNRYVGIWYKNIPGKTVVWVANKEIPLTSISGILKIIEPGILVLLNDTNNIIWSSKTTRVAQTPIVQLLDSGNLVLSSWKSGEDPAPGNFTLHLDPTGYPQIFIKRGNITTCRMGNWNGVRFSGATDVRGKRSLYGLIIMNKNKTYYREDVLDRLVILRITLSQNGVWQRWRWVDGTQGWVNFQILPVDSCDTYKFCGAYSSCNVTKSPACTCFSSFVPKDPKGWIMENWSNGCIRRTPLNCKGDVFLKYSGVKLPDSRYSWFNESMTLEECEVACLKNCSCMAYTQLDISRERGGCLFWYGDLVDIRDLLVDGQDIYIRMAPSELGKNINKLDSKRKRRKIYISSLTSSIGVVLLGLSLMLYFWKREKNDPKGRTGGNPPPPFHAFQMQKFWS